MRQDCPHEHPLLTLRTVWGATWLADSRAGNRVRMAVDLCSETCWRAWTRGAITAEQVAVPGTFRAYAPGDLVVTA